MKKIASFFGFIAFWSFFILGMCIWLLPYVGVKITYVCLPVGVISTLIWWIFVPKETDADHSSNKK